MIFALGGRADVFADHIRLIADLHRLRPRLGLQPAHVLTSDCPTGLATRHVTSVAQVVSPGSSGWHDEGGARPHDSQKEPVLGLRPPQFVLNFGNPISSEPHPTCKVLRFLVNIFGLDAQGGLLRLKVGVFASCVCCRS